MKILLLFSDTGGGHRAAAVAIQAALAAEAPDAEVELRDGLVDGGCWPLNRAPAIYEWAMRHGRWIWAATFHLFNGPFRSRLMADLGYPPTARPLKRLLRACNADVVISDHPLLTRSVARALRSIDPTPPFGIVVTDLVTGHWSWYDRGADRIFLPTQDALDQVREGGIPAEKLLLTGQAVHPRCAVAVTERAALRARFAWTETVVLMVGGGEGMGGLGDKARAIAAARPAARIVVVCGRNEALRQSLDAERFEIPVEVHGFVRNLHEMMAAADVLVTKGGPGSIMEGCVAGLPMLIYDYIPGQETGNVRLVEERGAGTWVRDEKSLVAALTAWLDDPASRLRAAVASTEMGVPDSATRIARGILGMLPARSS